MSWIKRRGPNTPSPAPNPPMQIYNPTQHSAQEIQWQNQQLHDNWYNQPQTQYQPVSEQETSTQPQQNYWQQPYNTPVYNQNVQQQPYGQPYQNQQQAGYYHNNAGYGQQSYGNLQYNQQYNQNNAYRQIGQMGQQNEGDTWNLAWGDEDNSNVQVKPQPTANSTDQGKLDEAFPNEQSWNWSADDAKQPLNPTQNIIKKEEPTEPQDSFVKLSQLPYIQATKPEGDSDLAQRSSAQDHMRISGKQGKLETPQWSTESPLSQESSDDILHTSESDKSHMMSRSSTISHSSISVQDPSPSQHQEVPIKSELHENKEILNVKQDLLSTPNSTLLQSTQHPNSIIPPPLFPPSSSLDESKNSYKWSLGHVKQELSSTTLPQLNSTPPPPKNTQTPPLVQPLNNTDGSSNLYKRSAGLSHQVANKFRASNTTPADSRSNLSQQSYHNQQVNLETLPDNSEQPDPVPNQSYQISKPPAHRPDNNEAPINDRNQYLETGHLSEVNLLGNYDGDEAGVRQDTSDTLPPPGLRRMVPGQMEHNENVSIVASFPDEPPPGLSRMVLGQTEMFPNAPLNVSSHNEDITSQYDTSGPPEGLRRMVPGESSSPESTLRHQQQMREDDSETEFNQLVQHTPQPRSATIGADTPPAVAVPASTQLLVTTNRSETIGAAEDDGRIRSAVASSGDARSDKNARKNGKDADSRRDSIEGQTQENDISNLTNSVRNLTVGENLTDGQTSNTSLPEPTVRRKSRQESSDSDRELKKLPRGSRDKRSAERVKRDKGREREKTHLRDRYSPDSYRDKKYDRRRYKDRRYEDDTDYYSDKEKERRMHDERVRDYERKYSSLRKDKERDRQKRDPRDYRRGEYYYASRYDDDEYENESRSRPSSRSDSIHEPLRERMHEKEYRDKRQRDKERERYRRHREPREMYNPYQGYAYDPYKPYYQQYQYYENLRRTNPQAYAEWYRKYYQQATGHAAAYGVEDRASVHSGRSSANDEMAKDRYTRQSFYSQASAPHMGNYYADRQSRSTSGQYGLDNPSYSRPFDMTDSSVNFEDSTLSAQRLTPAKFSTAHVKASIASGKFIRILPHYPTDGQNAVVEVCNLDLLLGNNEEFRELSQFPGPLVKGVTHKKTIIEYCENKIKAAAYNKELVDTESYILLWELLILLIRQNGMVVGTDIAELLLKNKRETVYPRSSSVLSSVSSNNGDVNPTSEAPVSENTGSMLSVLKEEEVTNKFRELLLYGSVKEALEKAMQCGLWGHALFLASKLDKRTYANVMMRFANGLTLNDPLQTLYQLLSGKMPAAVTCVSDEKWGDWRPHLAMILSNSTQRPELNCKAVTVLGDTLRNRGSLYAAQFCYLMAEVGFGKHDDPDTRLVLLGADHTANFPMFATNEAIHMTEIYEYACGLNESEFVLPQLQAYKYLLATRLADRGRLEESLAYLEKISAYIVADPSAVHSSFVDNVFKLADRLKYYDPVGDVEDESGFGGLMETSRPDNSWLKDLLAVQNAFQSGAIVHQGVNNLENNENSVLETDFSQPGAQETWQPQNDLQYQQPVAIQQPWPLEVQPPDHVEYQQQDNHLPQNDFSQTQFQDQQNYWANQQQQQQQQQHWGEQFNQYNQENVDQQPNHYGSDAQIEELPQPQISMPNQTRGQNPYGDGMKVENGSEKKQPSPVKTKPQSPLQEKTQSTGWFGGIFSKLALKPKNQMKLPDDKNPKIIWDQDKKRWVNNDEDTHETAAELLKPPPKMSDIMPKMAPQTHSVQGNVSNFNLIGAGPQNNAPAYDVGRLSGQPSSVPVSAVANSTAPLANTASDDNANLVKSSQPNMFKLQRGRNLKNSYIDVFNPGGKPTGPASLPVPDTFGSASLPQMNFFIPQSVSDPNAPVDFLTPGGVPHMAEQQ